MKHLKKLDFRRTISMLGAVFMSAFLLIGLTPRTAFAATLVTTGEEVLGQFPSGDVAWYKINVEKGTSGSENNKLRLTATVWCDNSSGSPVDCDFIEGTNVETFLLKDPQGPTGQHVVQHRDDYLDAANVHSKSFTHTWECEGTTLGIYMSVVENMFVISRFAEPMVGEKDRNTNWSALSGSC